MYHSIKHNHTQIIIEIMDKNLATKTSYGFTLNENGETPNPNKLDTPQSDSITCCEHKGCRSTNSLTTLTDGIYTLSELDPGGDDEWTDIYSICHGGDITKFHRNGDAELFNICMNFGLTVNSTGNHQWWVNGKWKRTDEIVMGDELSIAIGSYTSTTDAQLHHHQFQPFHSIDFIQPNIMTPDLGWLFGYLLGNKIVSDCGKLLILEDIDTNAIRHALYIIKCYFGVTNSTLVTQNGEYELTIDDIGLYDWLIDNMGNSEHTIPLSVRRSSQDTIIAFFAGWFDSKSGTYRYIGDGQHMPRISHQNDVLMNHMQHVAWAVGLVMDRIFDTTNNMHRVDIYDINSTPYAICKFDEFSIKFVHNILSTQPHKMGIVSHVESIGTHPTFDIETQFNWFMAGAVKSQ